jgi:hypothetical protein
MVASRLHTAAESTSERRFDRVDRVDRVDRLADG